MLPDHELPFQVPPDQLLPVGLEPAIAAESNALAEDVLLAGQRRRRRSVR